MEEQEQLVKEYQGENYEDLPDAPAMIRNESGKYELRDRTYVEV